MADQSQLVALTLLGGDWILWVLLLLSLASVAIVIDRLRYFATRRVDLDVLISDLRGFLKQRDVDGAQQKYGGRSAIEVVVGLAGLREAPHGVSAASESMTAAKGRTRAELERNLNFLATVGNNAPFIGLLGTVLGVIRAFRDLGQNSQAGVEVVMVGISEALFATAVGLVVAIPAVFMYNYFIRKVRQSITNADVVAHALLAQFSGSRETRVRRGEVG